MSIHTHISTFGFNIVLFTITFFFAKHVYKPSSSSNTVGTQCQQELIICYINLSLLKLTYLKYYVFYYDLKSFKSLLPVFTEEKLLI